jgi:hypothetical protein
MPIYFFDTRDGDTFVSDDDGEELSDLAAAKAVASISLAELARDVLPESERRVLIVEVRDEKRLVLEARLTYEAIAIVE